MWDEAQSEVDTVRLFGDLVVLAHFSGQTMSEREAKRAVFAHTVSGGGVESLRGLIEERREECLGADACSGSPTMTRPRSAGARAAEGM